MLRTAIDLKEAVENVADNIQPIGSCPLDVIFWEMEDRGKYDNIEDYDTETNTENDTENNTENDTEDNPIQEKIQKVKLQLKINKCVEEIRKTLKTKFYQEFHINSDTNNDDLLNINLDDVKYNGSFDIPEKTLLELFTKASDAPFGDVTKQETVVDKKVRDAKDISSDHFSVNSDVIKMIEDKWLESEGDGYLYPRNVTAVPYKINLYGKNGHFDRHQDTPGKDMVGTALIALSKSYGGRLELESPSDSKDTYSWNQKPGDCIMFYTDCPHKVTKVWDSNIRGTLAFKIYHNIKVDNIETTNTNDLLSINRTVEALKKLEEVRGSDTNYGFMLGHGYSLQTDTFKGKDHILVSALNIMNKKYTVIPVVHKWHVYSYHDYEGENEEEATSKVYPFTEQHIDKILKRDNSCPHDYVNYIEFYRVNGEDYVWKNEHQNFSEHVGNEAQPEEQNSIYLSRALVIG